MNKLLVFTFCAVLLGCSGNQKKPVVNKPTVITRYDPSLVIAYYNVDSVQERFVAFKKENDQFKAKETAYQKELERMYQERNSFVTSNDQKAKAGQLSENQILEIQKRVQTMDQGIMNYEQTQGAKLDEEAKSKFNVLAKKIEQLGKKYSELNKIDVLLIQGTQSPINYISPKMDVTKDFIEFLNKN